MANFDYTDDTYGTQPHGPAQVSHGAEGGRVTALVHWAGALISLGLIAGMGVWAFQLTMRDVSGVPVIEALEGPMRQPPADPGGTQAPHQGLAVNRIAEGAEAAPVPDQLVIAPPPVELRPVEVRPVPAAERGPEPDAADAAQEVVQEVDRESTATDTASLIDRLLREAHASGVDEPASARAPEVTQAVLTRTEVSGAEIIPASVPGVVRSPRPSARPGSFAPRSAGVPGPAPAGSVTELAVADLAIGTRLVQLGAFDTAEIARAEWDRLAGRFPEYFADRPRVVEEASSGGQAFFRLRAAGFDDLAASRRFCAVLVAEGAACIPVTVR
jgi:hypothetical protein